jgi:tetratricopeptide (TPR) repeat protein
MAEIMTSDLYLLSAPVLSALTAALLLAVLCLVLLAVLFGLWLLFGRWPRRSRAYSRAQRLLHQGSWEEALAIVQRLQSQSGMSRQWQGRLRSAEGECHHAAAEAALKERRYKESFANFQQAAALLDLDELELRERVVQAMLAEVRRLFAVGSDKDLAGAQALAARTQELQSPCPESSFWQGLGHVREGKPELALAALAAAHEGGTRRALDPPLYAGALLLRLGRPQEALRYLAEANRNDASCPLVTWQLGMAMVAAGSDSRIAVQTLLRACGPRGLGLWASLPVRSGNGAARPTGPDPRAQRLWVEALPENRSFVRRLALKYPFACPLLGNDVGAMLRQGQLALAQAQYRLGNFQEAADLYTKLLQESPPTVPLLRGLGLSLTRQQRYDQAYKHLRIALEQEEPKDHLTAGYLALCGALGKPAQPEDKPRNVAWAIRLLCRFDGPADEEWAGLMSAVFAEARSLGMAVAAEDQLRLCGVLASVKAVDVNAAAAYDQLAATQPDAIQPQHAWLYCWAATRTGYTGQRDLDLFARTFADAAPARAFYAERSWDLDEVEHSYLARCAAARPGAFPAEFGPEYPAQAEARLLERSRQQEAAGQVDAALAAADVLLKLAPHSAGAHDRLAYLHHRRNDLGAAAALLAEWHQIEPGGHLPLCRLAVVEQQRGNPEARRQAVGKALGLTRGPTRAAVAFLGARLALASAGESPGGSDQPPLQEAKYLLQECLKHNPDHLDVLWLLAAVRSQLNDRDGLATQAPAMHRPEVRDSRFQYMAAVCQLAARDYSRVVKTAGAAAADPALAADSQYLVGLAHVQQKDDVAAAAALQQATANGKAATGVRPASADPAHALLGRIRFGQGRFEDAVRCWSTLGAERKDAPLAALFSEALQATVFLTGVQAYGEQHFEQAATRFREAGRLGLRDRRLGPLLSLALFRAGQRLLYGGAGRPDSDGAPG